MPGKNEIIILWQEWSKEWNSCHIRMKQLPHQNETVATSEWNNNSMARMKQRMKQLPHQNETVATSEWNSCHIGMKH